MPLKKTTPESIVRQWFARGAKAIRQWHGGLWTVERPPEWYEPGMLPSEYISTRAVNELEKAGLLKIDNPTKPNSLRVFVPA